MKMELKGFSRGLDGGVTLICTSIREVHAESVLTRNAWTPSNTRLFRSFISLYSCGMTTSTAMMEAMEHAEAMPITNLASLMANVLKMGKNEIIERKCCFILG